MEKTEDITAENSEKNDNAAAVPNNYPLTVDTIFSYLDRWENKFKGSQLVERRKAEITKIIDQAGTPLSNIVVAGLGQLSEPDLHEDIEETEQSACFVQFGFLTNLAAELGVPDKKLFFYDGQFSISDVEALQLKKANVEGDHWLGKEHQVHADELTLFYIPDLDFDAIKEIIKSHKKKQILHKVIFLGTIREKEGNAPGKTFPVFEGITSQQCTSLGIGPSWKEWSEDDELAVFHALGGDCITTFFPECRDERRRETERKAEMLIGGFLVNSGGWTMDVNILLQHPCFIASKFYLMSNIRNCQF